MNNHTIRCCLFGGQEKDLYLLGELHKLPHVNIVFVFDKDPGVVGLEIAEILGIARLSNSEDIGKYENIEYAVVSEPRQKYADELSRLTNSGTKILSRTEAMNALCEHEEKYEETTAAATENDESFVATCR